MLSQNPKETITPYGIRIRKLLYPLLKIIIPLTIKSKIVVIDKGKTSLKEPVIFVSTHEFREDAEAAYLVAGRQTYILNGSVSVVMNTFDGIKNWICGMILVDRADKKSRRSAKEKMIYALNNGASILMYPEGTWNKSPNQIISGLFPGVYYVAKATGAKVIPIAHQRENKVVYSKVGEVFDIHDMSCDEAMELIKEKLSTLRYDLIEHGGKVNRKELPGNLDMYWKNIVDARMAEVPFYDYELELHTKFVEKNVVLPREGYAFFKSLNPNLNNAFLFKENEYWININTK